MVFHMPRRCLFVIAAAACLVVTGGSVASAAQSAASAVSCPSVDPATGAVTPVPSPGVDWSGCSLYGANLTNANLSDANLYSVDLTGANLASANLSGALLKSAVLTGADLSGTVLAGANMFYVVSGSVTGTPASLPGKLTVTGGYVVGPYVNLSGAGLAGFNLAGMDLSSAEFKSANLSGANLSGTNLTAAVLGSASLTNANLTNANLTSANLTSANLTGAILTGISAFMSNWLHATCPDGSNADKHIGGYCLNPLDTTPPVVIVTGAANGQQFILGVTPVVVGCSTTDDSTVVTPATLTVTTNGSNGVGTFRATCSGAVDLAGNHAPPVSVTYTVVYGFGGFGSPAPNSTIARSGGKIIVRFRLDQAPGSPLAASAAAALASAGEVQASLSGPGIATVIATCGWNTASGYFQCTIHLPAGLRTGSKVNYTISALENPLTGFTLAPTMGSATDPEVIHFK
jgi:uncharacterized protein YjbI with pentapeptide repeats